MQQTGNSRGRLLVALSVVLSVAPGEAQSPLPKFDVASIKRCGANDTPPAAERGRGGGGAAAGDPGMFHTGCVSLRLLIQSAYIRYADGQTLPPGSQLKNQPLQGGPEWIDSDRYAIDARPETPQTRAMMGGPMLQALLEDRFKLKVHRETREVPVYALVVAKGGPKLQPTKSCTPVDSKQGAVPPIVPGQPLPCGFMDGGDGGLDAVGVTVASLCQVFSSQVHQVVIDKTGLTGLFDYLLAIHIGPPGGRPGDEPTPETSDAVMDSLQKLGLKLEPSKGAAEFVVIDHVERPSGN